MSARRAGRRGEPMLVLAIALLCTPFLVTWILCAWYSRPVKRRSTHGLLAKLDEFYSKTGPTKP